MSKIVMVTDWAIDRLLYRADLENSNLVQGGGREWALSVGCGFDDFEKIAKKYRSEADIRAKKLRKENRSGDALAAGERQVYDLKAENARLREALEELGSDDDFIKRPFAPNSRSAVCRELEARIAFANTALNPPKGDET